LYNALEEEGGAAMTFEQEQALVGIVVITVFVVLPTGYFLWRLGAFSGMIS
jgi:hypothetical protein